MNTSSQDMVTGGSQFGRFQREIDSRNEIQVVEDY
jgi:hypothetical protein